MVTLTFKLEEDEARRVRAEARRARLTLSEFLRRQIRIPSTEPEPVAQVKCPHTGARIFAPAPQHPDLTTRTVRDMLADFP